jgi:dienelactone hydrolase
MNFIAAGSGTSQGSRQPAWTLGGKPLPFLTPKAGPDDSGPAKNLEPYERALSDTPANSDSEIPVERINRPVLLLSGEQDGIWPAGPMAERIVARLRAARFPYPFSHLKYPGAGHLVFLGDPASLESSRIAPLERAMGGTDSDNLVARRDTWARSLAFFRPSVERKQIGRRHAHQLINMAVGGTEPAGMPIFQVSEAGKPRAAFLE